MKNLKRLLEKARTFLLTEDEDFDISNNLLETPEWAKELKSKVGDLCPKCAIKQLDKNSMVILSDLEGLEIYILRNPNDTYNMEINFADEFVGNRNQAENIKQSIKLACKSGLKTYNLIFKGLVFELSKVLTIVNKKEKIIGTHDAGNFN